MSDGDEESEETPEETDVDPIVAEFEDRLASAAGALEDAETEADLDEVEATLDEIEADLEDADIEVPEPEDEDEEPEDPTEDLEDELGDLRDDLEDQRGPYGEDVVSAISSVRSTITDTRWADEGEDELVPGVQTFLDATGATLDADFGDAVADPEELGVSLASVETAVEEAELDADDDADAIASLLEEADELESGVAAATAWTDLEVRERLQREGFYEPLEGAKHKDFPPEWSALKTWEKRGNVEMVVLLLDLMGDSDFITRHCIDSLQYIGDTEGLDPLLQLAQRRNLQAIEAIGKIGAEEGLSAVEGHADAESNPALQETALRALGMIGSEESTETVAEQLASENENSRVAAARALGLIGDTRAIAPLSDVLDDEDEERSVRASAAWALYQIGTTDALEAAAAYTEDSSFIVEKEAAKAQDALDAGAQPA